MPDVYFSELGETITLTDEQWKRWLADLNKVAPDENLKRLMRERSILDKPKSE